MTEHITWGEYLPAPISLLNAFDLIYLTPRSGTGKTLPALSMAHPYVSGKTTLTILPMVAIHEQHLHRCASSNISCVTWSSRLSDTNSSAMVLVPVELSDRRLFRLDLLVCIFVERPIYSREFPRCYGHCSLVGWAWSPSSQFSFPSPVNLSSPDALVPSFTRLF
jgi:hypothetical protein